MAAKAKESVTVNGVVLKRSVFMSGKRLTAPMVKTADGMLSALGVDKESDRWGLLSTLFGVSVADVTAKLAGVSDAAAKAARKAALAGAVDAATTATADDQDTLSGLLSAVESATVALQTATAALDKYRSTFASDNGLTKLGAVQVYRDDNGKAVLWVDADKLTAKAHPKVARDWSTASKGYKITGKHNGVEFTGECVGVGVDNNGVGVWTITFTTADGVFEYKSDNPESLHSATVDVYRKAINNPTRPVGSPHLWGVPKAK